MAFGMLTLQCVVRVGASYAWGLHEAPATC